jgi:hydroxymethylpyrimidine/phosphomethylpyrimidine kinase
MSLSSVYPVALTIAGSDSGGGAGIQADLRTFAFHRVHGTSVLTCVTAQNTLGVTRVDALSPQAVVAQMEAVTSDIPAQAVKTGMLLNQGIIEAVTQQIAHLPAGVPVVVDPVMVSRSGAQLIDDAAVTTLIQHLIPQAAIVTPNRYEAELLTGKPLETLEDMETAARAIYHLGPRAVLVKGGGMAADLRGTDVWFDGQTLEILTTEIIHTPNTHGTGCTLSAAIAANLALGQSSLGAVKSAKQYVTHALHHALTIGQGQGPVCHFYPLITPDCS